MQTRLHTKLLYVAMDVSTFPNAFRDAALRTAERHGWRVREYEYWGVPILTISWDRDTWVHSLQFDLQETRIGSTRKREHFAGWRRVLRWAYSVVPMSPYLGAVVAEALEPLQLQAASDEYEQAIESYAQRDV